MKTNPSSLRRGFTLIELLIVVAIVGILAGIVSSAIVKVTRTAANKRNENNARRLQAAISEYWHDIGTLPGLPKNKSELKKIVWYSKENTIKSSIFVIISLIICAAVLGVLDFALSKAIMAVASII